MAGPLNGVKIVDLTTILMGPFATQLLGDMGADVIKIEHPNGDGIRYANQGRNPGMSNLFLNNNRNKRYTGPQKLDRSLSKKKCWK